VAAVLTAFAIGLPGYALQLVLVRSFYARQNSSTPALLNIGLFIVFVGFAYFFSAAYGLTGVAAGFSAAYTLLAFALLFAMHREIEGVEGRRLAKSLMKILAAGLVMYAVARTGISLTGAGSSLPGRALILCAVGGASFAAYFGFAFLLRTEELRSAVSLIGSRSSSRSEPGNGRETL
jgi:putative peptidoglycan lipid II flippase